MACVFELGGHSAKPYVYVNRVYYCFIVNNFNIFIKNYNKCARPFEKETPERLP